MRATVDRSSVVPKILEGTLNPRITHGGFSPAMRTTSCRFSATRPQRLCRLLGYGHLRNQLRCHRSAGRRHDRRDLTRDPVYTLVWRVGAERHQSTAGAAHRRAGVRSNNMRTETSIASRSFCHRPNKLSARPRIVSSDNTGRLRCETIDAPGRQHAPKVQNVRGVSSARPRFGCAHGS